MDSIALAMTWLVVAAALASVVLLLRRPHKSPAELLFAVFCGSMALDLLRPALESAPGWALLALAVGGCATCNVYWLVARALFRGEGGVGRMQIAAAALIAALIVGYRSLQVAGLPSELVVALGALLTLASSTVLVLAFAEALRGFGVASRMQQHVRLAFVVVYGGCLLMGTLSGSLVELDSGWAGAHRIVVLTCSLSILVFTHVALELCRRQPRPEPALAVERAAEPAPPRSEDRALAEALIRALERDLLYRDPELKVADLAEHVGSREHRVSRVITQVLGARNFSQWINGYRIEHACRVLLERPKSSVLEISLEAGFGSLGPFNRAFKAAKACTPSAWRAREGTPSALPSGSASSAR